MPIYYQGRKVKEVWHQGREVQEIWHMGRLVYTASRIRGFEGFLDQVDAVTAVSSLTASTATVSGGSTGRSVSHMLVGGDSAFTVAQGDRRSLHVEVRGGTVYAESTSQSGQKVTLDAPWPGGMHAVSLVTDNDGLFSYKVRLWVDGKEVAAVTNSGGLLNSQSVFSSGDAVVATTNTAAWGFDRGTEPTTGWIAESLQPGYVSWRTAKPDTRVLVPGGEVMAWAYSGGQGGEGGDSRTGDNGASGKGALIPGFTLDMLPDVTVGAGGKGGYGSKNHGGPGGPGGSTAIGDWFTTATATTRPTPQAWGSTYTGPIPGKGGKGGSSGNDGKSGSSGYDGAPGGLVIARRWT